jgi:hypothetical protein
MSYAHNSIPTHPDAPAARTRLLALALAAALGGMAGTALAQDQEVTQTGMAAQETMQSTPAPAPPAPPQPAQPMQPAEAEVTFRSLPPDSIVGSYKIDFGALDGNGDGAINRSEASANATLTAEFDAVDNDHNGRLSQHELKGWM